MPAPVSDFSIRLSTRIALKYDLSYKARIALRDMLEALIHEGGLSKKKTTKLVETFFKNLSFINHPPLLVIPDLRGKRG